MLGSKYASAVTKKTRGANAGVRIFYGSDEEDGSAGAGVRIFQCCDEEDWGRGCWGANIPML